jgi:putative thioredoxin
MAMEVTDANFEKEVLKKSEKMPVVVDFWASWCGPCQMLGPVIEKLAKEYKGKIDIVKCSVEENQETAEEYGIMSIPSVKMFKDGEIVDEFLGFMPESKIRDWLEGNL